ncbi:hypothetical protein JCM8097_004171 [Rhodosporidiobolus ruineniae]
MADSRLHPQQRDTGTDVSTRVTQGTARTSSSGTSAQIREAKVLAAALKGLVKRKEPWDRTLEMQREDLRKAYLRIIFSPPPPPTSASSAALPARPGASASSSALPSSTSASPAAQHTSRTLDVLNLLWLDTSHALIQSYRARLAELDKSIAAAPTAHKSKNQPPHLSRGGGGNGGDVQYASAAPPPGPVARRKLVHSFRQFLGREEDFWRTICGRLASRLYAEEAAELRPLGIIASAYTFAEDGRPADEVDEDDTEALQRRRAAVLLLAHKALICFGDLARYAELYGESSEVKSAGGGGRGGRGGRGGKAQQQAQKKVKNYSKAAECYNQARLLLPDNGNPSNQLAVLAQYASDPLSSVYHYFRALAVRQPFGTAKANLQITFKKAVARYFSAAEGGGEGEGDEASRFRVVFVALQGVLYNKERLADFPLLASRTESLFLTCLEERQLTSDVVVKIVVTVLSALWDARMSRSAVSSSATGTGTKGSSIAPAASTAAAGAGGTMTTEPHLLVHLLRLYTLLLRVSSTETNDLYTSNLAALPPSSSSSIPLAQNISAVLRRALPALRVLGAWLATQLEYVKRIEARLEASEERRRARRTARRGRTSTGTEVERDEAQAPAAAPGEGAGSSLETDGSKGKEGETDRDRERVSVEELRRALDELWDAMANYANSIKLAFPVEVFPPPDALATTGGGGDASGGVWLEEDVELLGFAPLRRGRGAGGGMEEGGRPREIRRVGRDVHPNEEHLMRISEGVREAERLAESPLTGFRLIDGAYTFIPRDHLSQETSSSLRNGAALAPAVLEAADDDEGEDDEMLDLEQDEQTEDDPVDRAMRVDFDELASVGDGEGEQGILYEEDSDEEDDDEQIVFEGNSRSRESPAPANLPPAPPRVASNPYFNPPAAVPSPSAPRTAADLRQQLFAHGAGTGPGSPLAPAKSRTPSGGGVPLVQPSSHASSPALSRHPSAPGHSIWGPPTASSAASSPLFHPSPAGVAVPALGTLPPPVSAAPAGPPITPRSFEMIPNLTHGSPAAQAAGWGWSVPPPPAPGAGQQQQQHQPMAAATLFGGSAAFAPPPHAPPPPLPHTNSSRAFHLSPAVAPTHSSQSQPSNLPPPPGFSTAFAGVGPTSPFGATSPFAAGPFAPGPGSPGGGWPAMPNGGGGGRNGAGYG